jgi:hypothetical protein
MRDAIHTLVEKNRHPGETADPRHSLKAPTSTTSCASLSDEAG